MPDSTAIALQYLRKTFRIDLDQEQLPTANELVSLLKGGKAGNKTHASTLADRKVRFSKHQGYSHTLAVDFQRNVEAYNMVKDLFEQIRISEIEPEKDATITKNILNVVKREINTKLGIITRGAGNFDDVKQLLLTSSTDALRKCKDYYVKLSPMKNLSKPQRFLLPLLREVLEERKSELAAPPKRDKEIDVDDLKENAHRNLYGMRNTRGAMRRHNKDMGHHER